MLRIRQSVDGSWQCINPWEEGWGFVTLRQEGMGRSNSIEGGLGVFDSMRRVEHGGLPEGRAWSG